MGSHPAPPAPVANAFTVDFEDWYQGLEIPLVEWRRFEDRIPDSGRRILAVLAEAGVRATFFVLGAVAERHPELVREIAAGGHEIATHGWSHTLVYKMAPETFRSELKRSIQLLEELGGQRVVGHRAPFFSITRQSLWALEILGEMGILYDSSIYPILNYRYGIEDSPRWPYRVPGPHSVIEFPITTWRMLGRNVPFGGGAYFRIYPYVVTQLALRYLNRRGHACVFYIHPWELDPGHPRIAVPRHIALTHYANLGATQRRLKRLLRDCRFAPMKEVLGLG